MAQPAPKVERLPDFAPRGQQEAQGVNAWGADVGVEEEVILSEDMPFEPTELQQTQQRLLLEGDFPELDREVIVQGRVLGKGAFGEVREGRLFGKMKVAVKTVTVKPDELHKLMRELNALAKCRHPNVLNLLGVCTQMPPKVLIITDLVDGGDLKDWLYRDHRFRNSSLLDKLLLMEKIADTLAYLHSIGVVHRDLKPENILMTSDGEPKICDFGLAKADTEIGKSIYTFVGTIHYMAPEIARGEAYDEKADVYSFGVILNEVLTGRRPFSEIQIRNAAHIFRLIRDGEKPKLCTNTLPELVDLINSCLDGNSRSINKRPSFSDIVTFLRAVISSQLASEYPVVVNDILSNSRIILRSIEAGANLSEEQKHMLSSRAEEIQNWAQHAPPADQGTWQECQRLKAQLAEMQALLPPGVVETVQKEENTPRPTPVVPHEQSHVQPLTAQSQSDVDPGREEKSCRIL